MHQPERQPQRRASWRGSSRIDASLVPTCSIPIAVQFSPTVWRQIVVERDELVDRPVAVDQEVRARPGSSPSSGSGASDEKVFHDDANELAAV